MEIKKDILLADWTWWKVGGRAQFFCQPSSIQELNQALAWAQAKNLEVTALGGGTNVLISDKGVSGLVVSLRDLRGIEYEHVEPPKDSGSKGLTSGELQLVVLAGTSKAELLRVFLKYKLAPALFLCGLPGDVGGGVVMNAGVSEDIQPREFCELVDWIEVLKGPEGIAGDLQRYQAKDLNWSYRHSSGWQPGVIVRVGLKWPLVEVPDISHLIKQATRRRLQRQPLNLPSCGSVFKNPEGHKAGALIEQCGLKGYRVGGVQVSEKHANFIVNTDRGTASDVHTVIQHVKSQVMAKFNVQLEAEVRYIGNWEI